MELVSLKTKTKINCLVKYHPIDLEDNMKHGLEKILLFCVNFLHSGIITALIQSYIYSMSLHAYYKKVLIYHFFFSLSQEITLPQDPFHISPSVLLLLSSVFLAHLSHIVLLSKPRANIDYVIRIFLPLFLMFTGV